MKNNLQIREKFDSFSCSINQEKPFGLKIRIEKETAKEEIGTICLLPKTEGPPLHKHVNQEETFSVIEGELFAVVDGKKMSLKAGESVRFPKNTPHTYANKSDEICVFQYHLTPGGDFTNMMREFERLSKLGKLSRIGELKTMIHLAAVISKFENHVRSVAPPHFVLKALGRLSRIL